jgi:hypothetical protein
MVGTLRCEALLHKTLRHKSTQQFILACGYGNVNAIFGDFMCFRKNPQKTAAVRVM